MKNHLFFKLFPLISAFICFGCSHAQKLFVQKSSEVIIDKTDGVNKEEAIFLATKYLSDNYSDKYELDLSRPRAYSEKLIKNGNQSKVFSIHFPMKNASFAYPFYWLVIVDTSTGEILDSRLGSHK